MNTNIVIGATLATASVAVAVAESVKTIRTERQKRRDIRAQAERDVAAIRLAGSRVSRNIATGRYRGQSIKSVLYDELEFETIIAYNEMYN